MSILISYYKRETELQQTKMINTYDLMTVLLLVISLMPTVALAIRHGKERREDILDRRWRR